MSATGAETAGQIPGFRECARCTQVLPVDGFYRDPAKRDGYSSYCRGCNAAYARDWRRANPERAAAQDRRKTRRRFPYLAGPHEGCPIASLSDVEREEVAAHVRFLEANGSVDHLADYLQGFVDA